MRKNTSQNVSRLVTLVILIGMMLFAVIPVASLTVAAAAGAQAVSGSGIVTTPGVSENVRYFKEDTSYDMTAKVAPLTFEFELSGCTHIAGSAKGGVIIGNYSEDASTFINVEAIDYGKIIVRGKFNGGSEWTATFYQSEADIRVGGIHHYTVTVASGWTGVSLYVDGVHKATRYPASLTLPNASDYTHPFRIGGDYSSGNTNYFKGLINSVALFSDIRTASEISADKSLGKTWSSSTDNLVAAYDLTRMGEAALRDYSGNGNKLVYNNGSGIQVENFGKYEIDQKFTANLETFEAWIYLPDYYTGDIAGTILGNYRSYNGSRVVMEVYKDGNPRLFYTNANGSVSYHRFTDVDLRTGSWQHLAIVHDVASGEARCYVNGELAQTLTDNVVAYGANVLDQNFLIGRDSALRYAEGDGEYWENRKDQYFKGFIKQISVYSDVRSAEEIAADYAGNSLNTDNLLASYKINPGDAYTDLEDVSGNGYKATYKQLLWEKEYVEPIDDYAYSFAIVGDTQTVNDQNPELLKNIYQWILNNKDSMNIQYVIGLGDITEYGVDVGHTNYDESRANQQWTDAKAAITMMDGQLPYSLIRGDGHDGIELFNQYFADHEGYTTNISGYYEEGRIDNVYHTFKVGDVDYMLLCLDHGTKDDVLVWANDVVAAHPNHRVIVTTHQYMKGNGSLSVSGETGNATAYNPDNNAADGLWDKFLSKHANICMVMCGHSEADDVVVTKQMGDHGNEVTQILVNPQVMDGEYYHGSKGMVAMLHFSADGERVQVQYYSTIKDTYRPTGEFTVSYSNNSHNYEVVVTNPTCTDKGYTTHRCSVCGYGYVTDETDALGHTEQILPSVDPTCTDIGLTEGKKCSVCDTVILAQNEIPANGHTEETITGKTPTCTDTGLTDGKKCTVCDTVTVAQTVIPADGHIHNAVITAPDCTNIGYITYTCSVCGDSYVSDEVDALGHTEVTIPGSDATCTESGISEGKQCTVCGEITVPQTVIPASGHDYETVVTAPTCTTPGYTTYTCACGYTYVADEVNALGHTNGDATVENEVAVTCTAEGSYDTVVCCVVCSVEISRVNTVVPATGHNYDNGIVTLAPTCTENGVKTFTCQNDKSHVYTEIIAANGHTAEAIEGKDPTCTETGLTDGAKCSICSEILLAQNVIPANGHTVGESVTENNVDSTCTTNGSYDTVVYCTVCNAETSRINTVVPAFGHTDDDPKDYICDVCDTDLCVDHTAETIIGKAPTCTESGLTDGSKCSICGEILTAQESIPANGHSYESVVTAPTCTESGYTTYSCSVCASDYTSDEVAALGHNYEAVVTAPTCTTAGYTTYICFACSDSYVADETEALGHSYEAIVTAPTCEKEGYTTYVCVCGDNYIEDKVASLEHSYEVSEEIAPTCTDAGKITYTCTACGSSYVATVAAGGHEWIEATTEAPKTCDKCGATEGEKLPDAESDASPDVDTDTEASDDNVAEASAFERFWCKLLNLIRRLFGITEQCICDGKH